MSPQRLSPDERRAAIIEATIPLVREHGYAVTTRQIADAAGVAEGTLFRVFEDKNTLVYESVCAAVAPDGLEQRIAAIDPALPLRERLEQATAMFLDRVRDVMELLAAVRLTQPPGGENRFGPPPGHEIVTEKLAELIEPDQDRLRLPPGDVARILRVLTFAGAHTGLTGSSPMSAEEIVGVLLDGVLDRGDHLC